MTLDWHSALAITLIGFAVGFVTGYGVRAFISYRRRRAADPTSESKVPSKCLSKLACLKKALEIKAVI
jgi:hypothetical protein